MLLQGDLVEVVFSGSGDALTGCSYGGIAAYPGGPLKQRILPSTFPFSTLRVEGGGWVVKSLGLRVWGRKFRVEGLKLRGGRQTLQDLRNETFVAH